MSVVECPDCKEQISGSAATCPHCGRWTDCRYYWDWDVQEDLLFSNRTNFFLVAESMLLGGVAVILAGNYKPLALFVSILLCLVGLFSTFVWWSANRKQRATVNVVKDRLAASDSRSRDVWDMAKREVGRVGVHQLVRVSMPTALFVAWVAILLGFVVRYFEPRLW